ncbi:hypothetical protein Asi03nite_37140 [Actinoplanes siamensis]|uniref:Uncharacterized protein n=1 Tax=Actinoplanes siamensis TaxID=1223317 RepID=A0A919N850_9ACTN|nr:hypothetical protein Asi03nite_37140 [Actinoplanes siamensis]
MFATPVGRSGEEKSRRAPDGGMARTVSVTWERVDAEDDGSRACPSVDRPATSRLLDLLVGGAARTGGRAGPITGAPLPEGADLAGSTPSDLSAVAGRATGPSLSAGAGLSTDANPTTGAGVPAGNGLVPGAG